MIEMTTPISKLTVGQFLSILSPNEQTLKKPIEENTNLIFGVESLSKFINCSIPTARKLIKSGRISYVRTGRKYIFDRETILFKLGNSQNI